MEKTTTAEGRYSLLYQLPQAVFNYLSARGSNTLRAAAREAVDLVISLCVITMFKVSLQIPLPEAKRPSEFDGN